MAVPCAQQISKLKLRPLGDDQHSSAKKEEEKMEVGFYFEVKEARGVN